MDKWSLNLSTIMEYYDKKTHDSFFFGGKLLIRKVVLSTLSYEMLKMLLNSGISLKM